MISLPGSWNIQHAPHCASMKAGSVYGPCDCFSRPELLQQQMKEAKMKVPNPVVPVPLHRCKGRSKDWLYEYLVCGKPGKVKYKGKWYCGVHDPVAVELRQKGIDARRKARWDAEAARLRRANEESNERRRRASTYDGMLAAMKEARVAFSHAGLTYRWLDEAIKEAERKS